jgi:hypothetical protein
MKGTRWPRGAIGFNEASRGEARTSFGGDFADGGGGRVLPIPEWMTDQTTRLPTEEEVEPWFAAVCSLWDDANMYRLMAARARQIAEDRYGEQFSRKEHVDYFTSLKPGEGRPLRSGRPALSGQRPAMPRPSYHQRCSEGQRPSRRA